MKTMKQNHLNQEQIAELLKKDCIVKCSPKSISYSNKFKILAMRQYAEGITVRQIFNKAGLVPELIGEYRAKECLQRWRKKLKTKGEAGLLVDERGLTKGHGMGRPKTKGVTDADRIKRLKIEVAYLKAKNDFLVKLRVQKKS